MPSRRAAPTRASAASGPGQLTSSADDRPGSVSDPCARNAPRQAASASPTLPADHLGRQPAHRPAPQIEQPGLARQRLAVLGHPHHVARALANSAGRQHVHDGVVAVQVEDVLAQPPGDDAEVHLGFDDDPAGDDVQPAGEAQQRGHLGPARAHRVDDQPAQLVLDLGRHRHGSSPPGPFRLGPLDGPAAGVGTVGAIGITDCARSHTVQRPRPTSPGHVEMYQVWPRQQT